MLLGCQMLVSEHSLATPANYENAVIKNTIISKFTETYIFITVLAPMEKTLPLQNTFLGAWARMGGGTRSLGTPLARPRKPSDRRT